MGISGEAVTKYFVFSALCLTSAYSYNILDSMQELSPLLPPRFSPLPTHIRMAIIIQQLLCPDKDRARQRN